MVEVLATVRRPVDAWAVAATLESFGLRDVDAGRYGEADIFALAKRVYDACRTELRDQPDPRPALPSATAREGVGRFVHFYVRGTLFALPMVVQTLSVLALGYGLWSYLRFDLPAATAVSVGTIASFLITGGFVQATGRLGRYYLEQKAYLLARQVCWRLVRFGAVATLVAGLAMILLNVTSDVLPTHLATQALVYYLLLSLMWLILAILYTLEQQVRIVACVIAGIAVIAVLRTLTPLSIYLCHWIGLAAAIIFAFVLARRGLDQHADRTSESSKLARLPRQSLLGYLVAPYFAYGVMYFAFLFLDRIVGWTAGDHPLFIWFNTPYEVGLDIALLSMVLTLAQLEYTIHSFSQQIVDVQKSFGADDMRGHNRYFRRFYLRQVLLLAVLSISSAPIVLYLVRHLAGRLPAVQDVIADPITLQVFYVGALAYALLVLALMNSVFFFSMSRVGFVMRGLSLALVVDLAVGAFLSRHYAFWYSVFGLAAGAFVFALITVLYGARVIRRLDYYYYAAF